MNEDQKAEERPFGGFSQGSGYEGSLEDGKYYPAKLIGLKERNVEQGQWPGWKIIWGFDIINPAERIEAMTSKATGEGSTAGEWLTALLGAARLNEHRTNRPITAPELAGRECTVLVQFNDRGWPRVKAVFPPQQASSPPIEMPPTPAAPTSKAEDYDDLPF